MKLFAKFFGAVAIMAVITATAVAHDSDRSDGNIVETAAAAGQFETLLAAATAAGLAPALSGDGPFTVFAPTDEAFGALPAGTVETLLREENRGQLANILKFHVIAGRVGSDALADGATLDTLAESKVTFTETEQGFTIEGARIVTTDINASNGIIHVIDRVILPPERMSRMQAEQTINRAIARGVPMFNHGNPGATVRIYAEAARTLVSSADLSISERNRLERGLSASNHSRSAGESAWQLRYALDDVMASLRESGQRMASQSSTGR